LGATSLPWARCLLGVDAYHKPILCSLFQSSGPSIFDMAFDLLHRNPTLTLLPILALLLRSVIVGVGQPAFDRSTPSTAPTILSVSTAKARRQASPSSVLQRQACSVCLSDRLCCLCRLMVLLDRRPKSPDLTYRPTHFIRPTMSSHMVASWYVLPFYAILPLVPITCGVNRVSAVVTPPPEGRARRLTARQNHQVKRGLPPSSGSDPLLDRIPAAGKNGARGRNQAHQR